MSKEHMLPDPVHVEGLGKPFSNGDEQRRAQVLVSKFHSPLKE